MTGPHHLTIQFLKAPQQKNNESMQPKNCVVVLIIDCLLLDQYHPATLLTLTLGSVIISKLNNNCTQFRLSHPPIWWLLACLLVLQSTTTNAGTNVTLRESYAGNLSFALTGGSFRTQNNGNSDEGCQITNTSSNRLTGVPSGAVIKKAYLYWAGSNALTDDRVVLNNQEVIATSSRTYDHSWTNNRRFYSAVADITTKIGSTPNKRYTLEDLTIDNSATYCNSETVLGGWAIVVIYEHPNEDFRVLNLYEGFQPFQNNSLALTPNNFQLPSNPQDRSGKHAHITWEGDETLGGTNTEFLQFEGYLLTDNSNPDHNQFNSRSNVLGTGNNNWTYGVDIDQYDISNYLQNSSPNSVETLYSSGQDLVFLSAELISVSNVPVADVSVTPPNTPIIWQANTFQTLPISIKNLGPNAVGSGDLTFTLPKPAGLTFTGHNNSNFLCSVSSTLITCNLLSALPNNAEELLELNFDVAAPSNSLLNLTAQVNLDNNPSLFDNHSENNTRNFTIDVRTPDLSISTLTLTDQNGGLLIAGDTITATLIIDDLSELNLNNINAIIDIPAFIENYTQPSGYTSTEPDKLNLNGINLLPNGTVAIEFSMLLESDTPADTIIRLSAQLNLNGSQWIITAPDMTVTDGSIPSAGNKQLYLHTTNSMSRQRPANESATINIPRNGSYTWELSPALLKDLTFSLTDISTELNFYGNGIRTGKFTNRETSYAANYNLKIELLTASDSLLASENLSNYSPSYQNSIYSHLITNLINALTINTTTIAAGQTIKIRITNQSNTSEDFLYRYNPGPISIKIRESALNNAKADGYSAVILKASTVINIDNIEVWDKPFEDNDNNGFDDSGAQKITQTQPENSISIRAKVSDPFGAFDISNAQISVTKTNNSPVLTNALMVKINDLIDETTTPFKIFESVINFTDPEIIGNWSINITANEGVEGDVSHTRSRIFKITPFLPNISLEKTIEVINDPINGLLSAGNKPKAIPGAELQYTVHAVNSGRGKSDDNTITLQDEIPSNAAFFIGDLPCPTLNVGSGPICFTDGETINTSGLSYTYISIGDLTDDIAFSLDGSNFDYLPQNDGEGYDPAIRYIRLKPKGALLNKSKNGAETPEFRFKYQIRLE